jgi:hypothetical protein
MCSIWRLTPVVCYLGPVDNKVTNEDTFCVPAHFFLYCMFPENVTLRVIPYFASNTVHSCRIYTEVAQAEFPG